MLCFQYGHVSDGTSKTEINLGGNDRVIISFFYNYHKEAFVYFNGSCFDSDIFKEEKYLNDTPIKELQHILA